MTYADYFDSKHACYSLAHTIAANGIMQVKLVDELRHAEEEEPSRELIIKAMLKILLSNFT
jgi:hypothetical protein